MQQASTTAETWRGDTTTINHKEIFSLSLYVSASEEILASIDSASTEQHQAPNLR
jgi:hypothetical protein